MVITSGHLNHPGISRMKAIARSYFWWSNLDKSIESLAKSCSGCQAVQAMPPAAPLHPWVWPETPWRRVHVDFGATLEDTLRDGFVCGLRHEAIRRRLLSEKDLTYTKAMEIACAMEAADTNAKSFKSAEPAIRKFSTHQRVNWDQRSPCYRCGGSSHLPADCNFKEAVCNHCNKKGHIARACRSRPKHQEQSTPAVHTGKRKYGRRKQNKTHHVQEATTSDPTQDSGDEYRLYQMTDRASEPITVPVVINGKQLRDGARYWSRSLYHI